jgi:hypothetical protein
MNRLNAIQFPSVECDSNVGESRMLLCLHNAGADETHFAEWYRQEHLATLRKALGGSLSVRVYGAAPPPSWASTTFSWKYMSLVELGSADAASAADAVSRYEEGDARFNAMVAPGHQLWLVKAIGPRYRHSGAGNVGMKILYFALTNPIPEEIEQFHTWYESVHVPEVIEHLPEYVGAQRYASEGLRGTPSPSEWGYLTIYNVETPDVVQMQENIPVIAEKKFQPLQSILPDSAAATWTELA